MSSRKPQRIWTIRLVFFNDTADLHTLSAIERLERNSALPGVWMEQLRYAGIGRILAENDTRTVFELNPPWGQSIASSKTWADMNAERMRSFGINAASAPKWDGLTPVSLE